MHLQDNESLQTPKKEEEEINDKEEQKNSEKKNGETIQIFSETGGNEKMESQEEKIEKESILKSKSSPILNRAFFHKENDVPKLEISLTCGSVDPLDSREAEIINGNNNLNQASENIVIVKRKSSHGAFTTPHSDFDHSNGSNDHSENQKFTKMYYSSVISPRGSSLSPTRNPRDSMGFSGVDRRIYLQKQPHIYATDNNTLYRQSVPLYSSSPNSDSDVPKEKKEISLKKKKQDKKKKKKPPQKKSPSTEKKINPSDRKNSRDRNITFSPGSSRKFFTSPSEENQSNNENLVVPSLNFEQILKEKIENKVFREKIPIPKLGDKLTTTLQGSDDLVIFSPRDSPRSPLRKRGNTLDIRKNSNQKN